MNKFYEYLSTYGMNINFGTRSEFALTRQNAITALNILNELEAVILGGDVFVLEDQQLVPSYANWSYDERADEPNLDISKRSILAASNYITNYPLNDKEPYFIFVLK
jgi:Immunity protein 40